MAEHRDISDGSVLAGLLTIVFVVGRLCDVITWSWWWVCSPVLLSGVVGLVRIVAPIMRALVKG
jgi:hypothetical protein